MYFIVRLGCVCVDLIMYLCSLAVCFICKAGRKPFSVKFVKIGQEGISEVCHYLVPSLHLGRLHLQRRSGGGGRAEVWSAALAGCSGAGTGELAPEEG